MPLFSLEDARPLGQGKQAPAGSVADPELMQLIASYKRTVASRYRVLAPEDLETYTPHGPLLVSPKVDGELWFLVFAPDEPEGVVFVNPRGRVLSGRVPALEEARKALPLVMGRTVVAGELFAVTRSGRPRVRDVAHAMSGEAEAPAERLGFMAFDLLEGGDEAARMPLERYPDRYQVLSRLFAGGKRVQAIRTEEVQGAGEVKRLFDEWVEGGKSEGLVARTLDGRIYKIKPSMDVDAVIVGYTDRTEDREQMRSALLALMREDGAFQLIGSVGGGFSEDKRREMKALLEPLQTSSSHREASSDGALYRFVRPEVVVEIKIHDVQAEDSRGEPVMRMVLDFDAEGGWRALRPMPGASIIHPRFTRLREDKTVNETDVRMAQILDRADVPEVERHVEAVSLPPSERLMRRVWTKTSKDKLMVRKLLAWKTNKDEVDPTWPAYVVHWTDYSSGRKDPLKREVRLAPDEATATAIAEEMVASNIKRGWEEVV